MGLLVGVLSKDLSPSSSSRPRIDSSNSRSSAGDQYLDCYEYTNNGGERLRAIDYIDNLVGYNFNNRISSCCFTGIWLLYADTNYNAMGTGAANWWQFGDNYCTDVPSGFENQASSLRYTGAPDAWTADTLNLYLNEFFIGGEESNYNGNCKCVWPSDTNNCYPGFYSTSNSLGYLARTVSSARRGCFCGSSAMPDNHPTKSAKVATSGFHKGN